jgi:DNA adenine methylase
MTKKLKKEELIQKCKELNITNYMSKNKKELVELIKITEDNIKKTTEDNIKKTTKEIENKNINYIKPIIKWVGGKTQILDKIIDKFPKIINNYHELFLGGGSVLIALLQNIKENKIKVNGTINAYDINETLINLYKNIQSKSNEIILEIDKIIKNYNNITTNIINRKAQTVKEALTSQESYYYYIRNIYNKLSQSDKNKPLGSAYLIFLNKTCFRGLYREGPNGFNVPFGNYKNPEIINVEHIKLLSILIKDVNFYHSDFEKSFEKINENDFVYLDPPYYPDNNKSFVNYISNGFSLEKHNILFTKCKKYNFLMSNADIDIVKNHFLDTKYLTEIILCKRSINSKNPSSKVNEVLIKSL